ncbi:hypothetical protein BSLG_008023 [Batrachochytrium salamandrivorans]|nr:hypothetical protein BSLG_008023 [Batrachochytrium salamandrivorans]
MPQSHTPTQPAFSYKPQQRKSNPKPQVYSHIVPTGTRIKGVGFVPTPTTPGSQGTPSPAKFPIEAPKGSSSILGYSQVVFWSSPLDSYWA